MEKQKLIQALAESQEDTVLLARIWDRLSSGERRNIPAASCFLSEREQILVIRMAHQGGLTEPAFFGGFSGAERKIAAYIPEYYTQEDYFYSTEGPVTALRVSYSVYDSLNHRDFLGSLMGQGIKREVIGDILPGEGFCDVLILREMVRYLTDNLTQVGRAKVTAAEVPLSKIRAPEQKVRVISDTVASMRLDSVMASGFRQGRSKAAALITAGKTEINHITVVKPDAIVCEGDIISARGLGKLRVAQVKGQTKKGRISVILERYL